MRNEKTKESKQGVNFISVIVVDDNPYFLKLTTDFLERFDRIIATGCPGGGYNGLAMVHHRRPDVAVIDLDMPDTSGFEVVRILRDELPDMGIIVLTPFDSRYYRCGALSASADLFVSKARVDKDLVPAIYRLADARRDRPQATRE